MDFEKISKFLVDFIKDQSARANVSHLVLGLSGGIDSAVVATLCARARLEKIHALLMPSTYSNSANLNDALNLCKKLKIEYKIIEIQPLIDAFLKTLQTNDKIRIGNISARIRMSLLYDYSAATKALVVGTSNKSELMLGYGTIYGDLACAFNPIGELFKSEIYDLAKFLELDEVFLQKAPSADLYKGQSDEAELGFSYAKIDEALKNLDDESFLERLDSELVLMVKKRVKAYAFKSKMPQIAQLRSLIDENDLA